MTKGIDYDDTYAPVATWRTIRLILTLAATHNWHTRELDYILAFLQAPAAVSKILLKFPQLPDFDKSFHYRSVIGKLNYLEKCTRPDIAYATHQCAQFTERPKVEHGKAVRWLARYLKGTMDKGIIMKPVKHSDLKMFVDADFAGNWSRAEANDRNTARSRHGYVITYNGCPLLLKSQLRTEIALLSTKSEYVGISSGLRDVIPITNTLKEMKSNGFPVGRVDSDVYC